MLWEILEARDSARVNRIHIGPSDGSSLTDDGGPGAGDSPMMLGKDTASRGVFTLGGKCLLQWSWRISTTALSITSVARFCNKFSWKFRRLASRYWIAAQNTLQNLATKVMDSWITLYRADGVDGPQEIERN